MIHVRVQHHPSRTELLPRLLEALSPLDYEVVAHSSVPPNPWEGYKRCLTDLPDCSHVLVIQDDALPCRNFVSALERLACEHPVCLFLGAAPASAAGRARRAMIRGDTLVPLGPTPFVPLVAVLWPREKAVEFLEWAKDRPGMTRADDGNASKWMRRTRQQFLVTVPSLVEHDDDVPSVKGGRESKGESWRRAILLAEDASDLVF